ncbi:DoxX family protein [Acidihalobacter prosperus]|uniref:DoxX family protein n=1 Tax=Acidihalobacter prosperus TaxID=160660 RepID=A0A1A6C6R1_9GAMM|nr:DoxX family protein [Acidihalobacter prosperus]OBS10249.1 hypothetical protein Thpro_021299 [Acidihalobacter prosperus]
MRNLAMLVGRILLAQIFVIAGVDKILAYHGTAQYMAAYGVPSVLLPLVILLEVGGGVALMLGWQARWIALALSAFSIVTAIIFHHDIANGMQKILLMGDLSFAGGLLVVAVVGAGRISLDGLARRD